jgi:hypothetical protein
MVRSVDFRKVLSLLCDVELEISINSLNDSDKAVDDKNCICN